MLNFIHSRNSLLLHPDWPLILHNLILQQRKFNGEEVDSFRLEIQEVNIEVQIYLLSIESKCVHCGKSIHPVKKRAGWRTLYIHVACDEVSSLVCCRSKEARKEFRSIVAAAKKRRVRLVS